MLRALQTALLMTSVRASPDHYQDAQATNCYTLTDSRADKGSEASVYLMDHQHDFLTGTIRLRWANEQILFDVPMEPIVVVQSACLAMQEALLKSIRLHLDPDFVEQPGLLGAINRGRLDSSQTRHPLHTFGQLHDPEWSIALCRALEDIALLHAARFNQLSALEDLLRRWKLMLDHLLAQLLVVAVHGCLELALKSAEPATAQELRDGAPGRCKIPMLAGSSGPVFVHYVRNTHLSMPKVFFNEVQGLRSTVLRTLVDRVARGQAEDVREVLTFLELGVDDGRNAHSVLESRPWLQYIGVDTWDHTLMDDCQKCTFEHVEGIRESAKNRLRHFKAHLMRVSSSEAMLHLPPNSMHLIFVDADHHHDGVLQDLQDALKVLAPGGIIAGHDFTTYWFETVVAALGFARKLSLSGVEVSADGVWWLTPK
mmetsp:Transcript_83473/g.244724  ORF Transcript_83473/g.244724 Transcript_83473/m.244724 type:complete len:427 (-) Transcript_83473:33-1313(-)